MIRGLRDQRVTTQGTNDGHARKIAFALATHGRCHSRAVIGTLSTKRGNCPPTIAPMRPQIL